MTGPRIHVVGCHETNHPWGFETKLIATLQRLGCRVIATDYRKNRARLDALLATPAEVVLVCKGERIPPDTIARAPGFKALWYAEQIGTPDATDELADIRRAELGDNVRTFDAVFLHDQSMLATALTLGAASASWMATACVDPDVHRKLDVAPRHDVVFAGSVTPRRVAVLDALSRRVPVTRIEEWDPHALNRIFNESRVVLNLHLSDLDNTETRVAEVLGAGACLVTEHLSSPDLVTPGTHVVSAPTGDVDALAAAIETTLADGVTRTRIAADGYAHVHAAHTLDARVRALLARIVEIGGEKTSWPRAYGVLHDAGGRETTSIDAFRDAVVREASLSG